MWQNPEFELNPPIIIAVENNGNLMNGNSLHPGHLIEESLSSIGPIYTGLLILGIPSLIISLLTTILGPAANIIVILFSVIVVPMLTGTGIYYAHEYLSRQKNDLRGAFNFATSKWDNLVLAQLLLVVILVPCFIAFIIPGIYVLIRLSQMMFGVILENQSPMEALQYSWEVTQGRWWPIFWAILAVIAVFGICVVFFGYLIPKLTSSVFLINLITGGVSLVITPIFSLYTVLLHRSLRLQS